MIKIDNYIYLFEKDKKITSVGFSKKEIKNHKGISGLKYYLIILYLRKHVQTFGQVTLTLNDLLQEFGYSTNTNNKSIYSDFREIIKTEIINKGYASCSADIFVVKPNDLFYLTKRMFSLQKIILYRLALQNMKRSVLSHLKLTNLFYWEFIFI